MAPPTQAPQPAPKTGGRWGWRAAFSFLAGGLVAAAGFAAAQIGTGTPPPTETVEATSAAATTVTAAPPTSLVLDLDDIEEPAALVAVTLGPAVVQIESDVGLGSGVIYGDGLILTNNHVIEGATQLRIRLSTGETLEGEVVGAHKPTDVAVVSVGPGRNLPQAPLALDEEVQVGQTAVAIGSPFQLQQSVTAGIVSSVNRPVPNEERTAYIAMIQTDAPINPGNSGGALANREGRVIGINTSIFTESINQGNNGIGFAIPIETAIRLANLIVDDEPIVPGFLGVGGVEPDGGEAGVAIADITPGSAAEEAGLRVGDRLLSLDGTPVTSLEELAGLVLARQSGDVVLLDLMRNGQQLQIEATLGARSQDQDEEE